MLDAILNMLDTEAMDTINKVSVVVTIASVLLAILGKSLRSPFRYKYFTHYIDVTGRRSPQPQDMIDEWLNAGNFYIIQGEMQELKKWKDKCRRKIRRSVFSRLRAKQYKKCLDEQHTFTFILYRKQTRYKQRDYVKSSYQITQEIDRFECGYGYLKNRNEQLRSIGYSSTIRDYQTKTQRNLMSRALRNQIMIRDNYTCQICGKYMPDEVGLQIDHIIPVSKGGTTTPNNLQVLCSKCNGRKSNKYRGNRIAIS